MSANCEIPRWQQLKQLLINLGPAEFRDRLAKDQEAVLVDVRTKAEVAEGTLPGAIHIDYFSESFYEKLEQLDRLKNYYLICRTGRRSIRTGILMKNWGFRNLINLEGGLVAWREELGNY